MLVEINSKLLNEIADKFEADPDLHNQKEWASSQLRDEAGDLFKVPNLDISRPDRSIRMYYTDEVVPQGELNYCGTAFCISGMAMSMNGWTAQWVNDGDFWTFTWIGPGGRTNPDFIRDGAEHLGLELSEARMLFESSWKPKEGMTVSDALRAIAAGGASVASVSDEDFLSNYYPYTYEPYDDEN